MVSASPWSSRYLYTRAPASTLIRWPHHSPAAGASPWSSRYSLPQGLRLGFYSHLAGPHLCPAAASQASSSLPFSQHYGSAHSSPRRPSILDAPALQAGAPSARLPSAVRPEIRHTGTAWPPDWVSASAPRSVNSLPSVQSTLDWSLTPF